MRRSLISDQIDMALMLETVLVIWFKKRKSLWTNNCSELSVVQNDGRGTLRFSCLRYQFAAINTIIAPLNDALSVVSGELHTIYLQILDLSVDKSRVLTSLQLLILGELYDVLRCAFTTVSTIKAPHSLHWSYIGCGAWSGKADWRLLVGMACGLATAFICFINFLINQNAGLGAWWRVYPE